VGAHSAFQIFTCSWISRGRIAAEKGDRIRGDRKGEGKGRENWEMLNPHKVWDGLAHSSNSQMIRCLVVFIIMLYLG